MRSIYLFFRIVNIKKVLAESKRNKYLEHLECMLTRVNFKILIYHHNKS